MNNGVEKAIDFAVLGKVSKLRKYVYHDVVSHIIFIKSEITIDITTVLVTAM